MAGDSPVRVAGAMAETDFPHGFWPAFLSAAAVVSARLCPGSPLPARPSHPGGGHRAAGVPDRKRIGLDLALVSAATETAHGRCHRRADPGYAVAKGTEVPGVNRR